MRAIISILSPGVERRPQLLDHLLGADQLLPRVVAALLGRHLVLEVDRGRAEALELAHGTDDVERVAVAGVGVGDDWQRGGVDNLAQPRQHLGHRQQAEVRHPAAPGHGAAAAVDGGEARRGGDPRRQPVVYPRRHDNLGTLEQLGEPLGPAHNTAASSATGTSSSRLTTSIAAAGPPSARYLASSASQLEGP